MKDQTLLQIANSLSVNVQRLTSPGLLEGKMGVAVFLYHYAKYSGRVAYGYQADSLMDEIIASVSDTQLSFSNGLSGIGWGIRHFLKENFIRADDDLLTYLDNNMIQYIKQHTDENMLDSCMYLTFGNPELLDDRLMTFLAKQLFLFLPSGSHSLATLNKLLAVANHLPGRYLHPWYDILLNDAIQAIKIRQYRLSDLMICSELLEKLHGKERYQAWKALHDRCKSLISTGISQTDRIETVWQNLVLSGGAVKDRHDVNWISTYVTDKLKDLNIPDLCFSAGLPALGIRLLMVSD